MLGFRRSERVIRLVRQNNLVWRIRDRVGLYSHARRIVRTLLAALRRSAVNYTGTPRTPRSSGTQSNSSRACVSPRRGKCRRKKAPGAPALKDVPTVARILKYRDVVRQFAEGGPQGHNKIAHRPSTLRETLQLQRAVVELTFRA